MSTLRALTAVIDLPADACTPAQRALLYAVATHKGMDALQLTSDVAAAASCTFDEAHRLAEALVARGLLRREQGFYDLTFEGPDPARRARKDQRVPLSQAQRSAIFERDGRLCAWCGALDSLEIDHVVPVSRGGTNDSDNLRVLCSPCNREKGSQLDSEMDR